MGIGELSGKPDDIGGGGDLTMDQYPMGGGGEGGKEKRPPSKKGDPVQLSKLENDQDPLL